MNRQTTFTLSERDLRRAGRLHVFSWIRQPRSILKLLVLWIVAIVVFLVFMYWSGVPWAALFAKLPLFALLSAVMAFGVPLLIPLALGPIIIRRRFRQDKLLRQSVTARWDESAYEAEQPGIHNRILWHDYSKWHEDKHLFLFFLSDYSYQILPKRALTAAQIEDLQRVMSA